MKKFAASLVVLSLIFGSTSVFSQSRIGPNALPGLGIQVDNVSSNSTYTVACGNVASNSDATHEKLFSNASATPVTLFKAGSCAWAPSFAIAIAAATGAGAVTITPTTSTIGIYGGSQGSTLNVLAGQLYFIYTDISSSGCTSNGCYDAVFVGNASGFQTLTDAATVTWALGSAATQNATLTFTVHSGSRTLNLTGLIPGGNYVLQLIQDGTGGEGLTLGTGCTWKVGVAGAGFSGTTVTPQTGPNAIDVLAFTYDGTKCLATFN